MLLKSAIVSSGSGSVGGFTLSHNKGGMYLRSRAIPTNPNSTQQQTIRTAVANLTSRWNNILTEGERVGWDLYAANVPLLNPLGDPLNVTGLNMYIRSNVARYQTSAVYRDIAPTTYNLGEFTQPVITAEAAGDTASVTFDNTDEWANEDDSAMVIYASRPQNASINYFKGPYRYMDIVEGDGTTPPTSPASMGLPFAVEAGQKVFFRAIVYRVDGRVSHSFRTVAIAS